MGNFWKVLEGIIHKILYILGSGIIMNKLRIATIYISMYIVSLLCILGVTLRRQSYVVLFCSYSIKMCYNWLMHLILIYCIH